MAIPRPHRNEHHYIPDPGKDHIVFDGEGIIVFVHRYTVHSTVLWNCGCHVKSTGQTGWGANRTTRKRALEDARQVANQTPLFKEE